jgi:hypothetical protein
MLSDALAPEYLVPGVTKNDADVWAIAFTVKHFLRPANRLIGAILPHFAGLAKQITSRAK